MKHLRYFEKSYNENYWLIPSRKPYIEYALLFLGMGVDMVKDWISRRYTDDKVYVFKTDSGYWSYTDLANDEANIGFKNDARYMGEITEEECMLGISSKKYNL
jgi:hypothetical protein